MKYSITYTLIFVGNFIFSQTVDIDKVDTSNYYNYNALNGRMKYLKAKKLMSASLKEYEVLDVIKKEAEQLNISNVQSHVIYQLDNSIIIVLDGYLPDQNLGFIYVEIITGISKENRDLKSPYRHFHDLDYQETHYSLNKTDKLIQIKDLPPNIMILSADNYWFQYTEIEEDRKFLISKEIAKKILSQDISGFIIKRK